MSASNEPIFGHEKLEVYRESIAFVAWLSAMIDVVPNLGNVKEQIDRAATSIPLNIAEGNGKYTGKDRCKFFDIARGSALECAAALDVLVAKNKIGLEQANAGKEHLLKVVRMLIGLIKRNSEREYERSEDKD